MMWYNFVGFVADERGIGKIDPNQLTYSQQVSFADGHPIVLKLYKRPDEVYRDQITNTQGQLRDEGAQMSYTCIHQITYTKGLINSQVMQNAMLGIQRPDNIYY